MARPARPIEQMYEVTADGCWIWTASYNGSGYPSLTREGRSWLAHRYLWHRTHGPIPDGVEIRHTCGHSHCVNPDHRIATRSAA